MTKKLKIQTWALLAVSAVLMSLPFLVRTTGPLALFSFVPLFIADRILYENRVKRAWLYFFTAFLAFNVASTFWIWFVSEAGAVAAILLNSLQMTLVFGLFRWFRKMLDKHAGTYPRILPYIFLAVCWLTWEHFYFEVELSWPWLVLGNAFATSTPLVQWYSVTGALGGTLWIFLTGIPAFMAICPENRDKRIAWTSFSAASAILPAAVSLLMYFSYNESGQEHEVVVVQPNIDPFAKYGVLPQANLDTRLLQLAEQSMTENTRLVVTPETFTFDIDIDHPQGSASMERYAAFFSRHPESEMLLGALTYRTYTSTLRPTRSASRLGNIWVDQFNTAMLTDGSQVSSHYFKSKLVPGVEIIPYQNVLTFLGPLVQKFGGSPGSYGTQDEMEALEGKTGIKVGAMVCYESVYGDYSRVATKKGADVLAVMTNDGWWGDTPGYRQHFRFAKLRAIENRRDVIHAANTGISGIIDQKGDVLTKTGWWEECSFRSTIRSNGKMTFFVRHGDVTGRASSWIFILLLAALVVICVSGKRFSRGRSA